ncbi:MAG: flagellar hook-basal body protein [Lachnospiraceae bacterium]|nr:flagellar hook-basal body protein [Lachnospiraceae bacterium]
MVRSLWTAATGMIAQQTNVDTIANNLANVNTTGYKTEVAEFKSLLYQTLQAKTTSANGEEKPIGAQVGLGVRNSAITSIFKDGSVYQSENDFAFAISGRGFFAVQGEDNTTYYTRNGNFGIAVGTNGLTLTDSDGRPVLDTNGKAIVFNKNLIASEITVDQNGTFYYPDANNQPKSLGITLGVYQFNNPAGLDKVGNSLFAQTAASGQVLNEAKAANLTKSKLMQGYLEGSSVQVADEMVNLIVAQRAYEMNSKAIQASDEMLQQANQLRR